MFLDPNRPITTCIQTSCEGCLLRDSLHCHFRGRDLARFLAIALPSFILGGIGLYRVGAWSLIPWIILIFAYFGFIEIRAMCSHCPHYAEPSNSLKCWANYGSPKLWHYRPGPMSTTEKAIFLGGLILVFGYPPILLIISAKWIIAAVYGIAVAGAYVLMRKSMCSQCMNFACPLNLVSGDRKIAFFERNPRVAAAWGHE